MNGEGFEACLRRQRAFGGGLVGYWLPLFFVLHVQRGCIARTGLLSSMQMHLGSKAQKPVVLLPRKGGDCLRLRYRGGHAGCTLAEQESSRVSSVSSASAQVQSLSGFPGPGPLLARSPSALFRALFWGACGLSMILKSCFFFPFF